MGETLKLSNVATWWCGQPAERALVERNIDTLAIAGAFGGKAHPAIARSPRMLADLESDEREALRAAIQERPVDFVGQEVVRLSTTPTFRDGKLQPSPFILRVYAARTEDGWRIMPGGFCRISDQKDARALSMGAGAQASDVWVIAEKPVEKASLLAQRDGAKVRRITGNLPSRAADNLFWLGRYLERAESTLRLIRSLCTSLMDPDAATHSAGETLDKLKALLVASGAVGEEALNRRVAEVAEAALYDQAAFGSVVSQVRSARRAAASIARAPLGRFLETPPQSRNPFECA